MMKNCRVCNSLLGEPALDMPGPALTSMSTTIDVATRLWLCRQCGHAQSPDLPQIDEYYSTLYKISLDSEEHDQLYAVVDGTPVFRTDLQADIALTTVNIPEGGAVLDYGAAKGATLRKILAKRPDIQPHVFDVSSDYRNYWRDWVPVGQWAMYDVPDAWSGRFDLVTSYFVLEHVQAPVQMLRQLSHLLKPGGSIFLMVPDPEANSGDLMVADHLNHFTEQSVRFAFAQAGLEIDKIDREGFVGAFTIVARRVDGLRSIPTEVDTRQDMILQQASQLMDTCQRIEAIIESLHNRPFAIYGAGFYGTLIAKKIPKDSKMVGFIDRNPHIQSRPHMGWRVFAPGDLPDHVDCVIAGLNPRKAKAIMSDVPEWAARSITTIYLD